MDWIVKLQRHGGQYRITLPGDLIVKANMENVEIIKLEVLIPGVVVIKEYDGKGKKVSGIQEDKS